MPDLQSCFDEPPTFLDLPNEVLFSYDPSAVQEQQFELIRARFAGMRSKIGVLGRLADDLAINDISAAEDITALCFPHTTYKSYSLSYIEQGRFDRLNKWFGSLTAHDLSRVDLNGVDSMEGWLNRVEAATSVRALCSSGTSGKISFFPRDLSEHRLQFRAFLKANAGYRNEPNSGLESGEIDYFAPWPIASGRQSMPNFFRQLDEVLFKDKPGKHVHTLGNGHWDVDLLWLSGRISAAERKGELAALQLTPKMTELRERLVAERQAGPDNMEEFFEELFVRQKGKRLFLFAPYNQMIPLAQECIRRELRPDFAPGTYVLAGGRSGSKGVAFPDDWEELCHSVFPGPYQEVFGMTETTASARLCSGGHFHQPPWIATFLLDPDTSAPLERRGVKTGRYAFFDLMPSSYWGGIITGDRITMNWDGDCPCGRSGPYMHQDITRYGNLRDDDKITCSKSPDAYEKAVELTLGVDSL
ncbi:MAG: hypothetical protein JOY99_12195 [Sphingomonadaceae bacterium]|nr:hypothetical protein [Sphingomonadaceae bacterium]